MTGDSGPDELRCYHCGNPNVVQSLPVAPIEELEQLADEWEDTGHNPETDPHDDGMATQLKCSQELRDLIAEYDNE